MDKAEYNSGVNKNTVGRGFKMVHEIAGCSSHTVRPEKLDWTEDAFEDYVARALIALYETKIAKGARNAPKSVRLTEKHLAAIRKSGMFIPAPDRITWARRFDADIDGIPAQAMFTTFHANNGIDTLDSYVDLVYARRITRREVPGEFMLDNGIPYELTRLFYLTEEVEGLRWFAALRPDGTTSGGIRVVNGGGYGQRMQIADQRHAVWLAASLNYYTDRMNTWLVQATEDVAKATFGVYPEQIKSLFYARSLPVTAAGRKRPILHWVKAHKRRLEKGIDVDVTKHLRGATEFTWNGTSFRITNPTKHATAA